MSLKDSTRKRKSSKQSSSNPDTLILGYAARGWAVFPCWAAKADGSCTCHKPDCDTNNIGKHPIMTGGFHKASKDPAQIRQWVKQYPCCNWAVATGSVSGITVVDIDIGEGKMGDQTWEALIAEHGDPFTLTARTGGGGYHYVFAYDEALKTGNDRLGKHVDVKSDGGYILVAPSNHRSGGTYAWDGEWTQALTPVPEWMVTAKTETRGRPKKGDDSRRRQFSMEEVGRMLKVISAENRTLWLNVGVILGRAFNRHDDAWALYQAWADKYEGERKPDHDKMMRTAFYVTSQVEKDRTLTLGTIVHEAKKGGWAPIRGLVPIERFVFLGDGNNFLYRPTCSEWIAPAVDAAVSPVNEGGVIIKATEWIRQHQLVTSMTCDPGLEGDYIRGIDCLNGEIVETAGAAVFNKYRPSTIVLGDATKAGPAIDHVNLLFNKPGDAVQFWSYMAHRVQKPWEKPRFALVIGGPQGNGKDSSVEFCVPAIGSWNVAGIEPAAFLSSFNEYAEATLIRISETSNLLEMSKWAFNERTKVLIAGRPDYVIINPKCLQKYSVRMFCGVIMTTNNLLSGFFIPEGDRRYDVMDTATLKEMGIHNETERLAYFNKLWGWYSDGGAAHVAAYLHAYDISQWNPSGQRKTAAHRSVVSENRTMDLWLVDIIEELGSPEVLRSDWVTKRAIQKGEKQTEVAKRLSHAIGRMDYIKYPNPDNKDDRWPFYNDKKELRSHVIYVKEEHKLTHNQIMDLAQGEKF